jgi:hypothetical protein
VTAPTTREAALRGGADTLSDWAVITLLIECDLRIQQPRRHTARVPRQTRDWASVSKSGFTKIDDE